MAYPRNRSAPKGFYWARTFGTFKERYLSPHKTNGIFAIIEIYFIFRYRGETFYC